MKEVEFIDPAGYSVSTDNVETMKKWLRQDYLPAHRWAEDAASEALGVDWRTIHVPHKPIRKTLEAEIARPYLKTKFDKIVTISRPDGRWDVMGENISERKGREYGSKRITVWTEDDLAAWEAYRQEIERCVNLTPHDVAVCDPSGRVTHTIPASGMVARVETVTTPTGRDILGAPVVTQAAGEITDLPDPDGETTYIVSLFVRQAIEGRPDVVAPDTGPGSVIRDGAGQIVGVRRWIGED